MPIVICKRKERLESNHAQKTIQKNIRRDNQRVQSQL